MKPVKFAALVAAVSLSTIGAAHAVVTTTAPFVSHGSHHVHCSMLNLGTKPVQVTKVELFDGNGVSLGTNGGFPINPNVTVNMVNGDVDAAFCRFDFKGSPKKVRTGMHVMDSAATQFVAYIPAT